MCTLIRFYAMQRTMIIIIRRSSYGDSNVAVSYNADTVGFQGGQSHTYDKR